MKGWTLPTSNRYGSNRRASVNSVGCAHPASRGWSPVADRPLRDASHWSVRVDAEDVGKSLAALVGEVDGAAALGTPDPAEIEQAVGERRADGAGQVRALLAPVDAVADGGAPRRQGVEVDAELLEEHRALLGDPEADGAAGRGQPVAERSACARVPSRSDRTGDGGATLASASRRSATSGPASRK